MKREESERKFEGGYSNGLRSSIIKNILDCLYKYNINVRIYKYFMIWLNLNNDIFYSSIY